MLRSRSKAGHFGSRAISAVACVPFELARDRIPLLFGLNANLLAIGVGSIAVAIAAVRIAGGVAGL